MENKIKVVTFAGSLRLDSYNKKLAKSAFTLATENGAEAILIDLADYPLPLFNEDIENQERPEHLAALREIFLEADALIIASPEYNGSLSSVLKNTLDWLSRSSQDESYQPVYGQLTAGIMAASPGGLGGIRGLSHLRELMSNLGSLVIPKQLAISSAYDAFDEHDNIKNPAKKAQLESVVKNLIHLGQALKSNN